MKLVKEFKEFAMRGNVVDMAVGVIIGTAFGKIVSELIAKVIMPPLGILLGKVDFKDLKWVLQEGVKEDAAKGVKAVAEVAVGYGAFLQTVLDFVIIAFVIFMAIKMMNRLKRKEEAAPPPAPAAPPPQEVLLAEIRDLLKNR